MNLICGINPVLEALAAGTRHFDRLLVVKGIRNRRVNDALTQAGQRGIPLRFESRETLDRIASGVNHQGLIAVVSAKPLLALADVAAEARGQGLLVALDGVEDPRNLGAILRTAEAAGADGVLLPERRSVGLSEVVARASAGALEHVRVARVGNLVQALGELKQRGYWVVGFDAAGTERWDQVDMKRPVVLVLGGEGRGIRRLVRENCDHVASVPLFGHVGSLNVSVVAGIALYEVLRQRGATPSHVRPIPLKALAAPRNVVGPAADDTEHDPGAALSGPRAVARDDEHDEPQAAYLIHEEPAWVGGHGGGGPTIEHAPRLRRDKKRRRNEERPRGRDEKRRGRERTERGDAPRRRPEDEHRRPEGESAPVPPEAAPEVRPEPSVNPALPASPEEARRRRRRRRSRRPPGAPADRPDAAQGPPRAHEGGKAAGEDRRADRGRKRRRRRRRPGGGPAPSSSAGGGGAE